MDREVTILRALVLRRDTREDQEGGQESAGQPGGPQEGPGEAAQSQGRSFQAAASGRDRRVLGQHGRRRLASGGGDSRLYHAVGSHTEAQQQFECWCNRIHIPDISFDHNFTLTILQNSISN